MATTAYIMIEASVGKVSDVASALRSVPGVTMVDVVIGPYDIIATVSGGGHERSKRSAGQPSPQDQRG